MTSRSLDAAAGAGETWMVTGGAGYIGGHVVRALRDGGAAVVVLDDLSTGDAERIGDAALVTGSVTDEKLVASVLSDHQITGVIHLAARKAVAESVAHPLDYYWTNVEGTRALLSAMLSTGTDRIVYSSSAAVYGITGDRPVSESDPCRPLSPYGETKLVGEWLLSAAAGATGLRYVALRYFNVAGAADPALADRGCDNLIPLALSALRSGRRPRIFGADYDTPDGTGVRDYIHPADVASAHIAVTRLLDRPCAETFNVGQGRGYSVRDVLAALAEATGISTEPEVVGRRQGDPASVVADVAKFENALGWRAAHDLRDIVASACSAPS